MALKPFSVKGEFSGRTTPIAGGPKVSQKEAWMDIGIYQRDGTDEVNIVHVKSYQTKRRLVSEVTITFPDEREPVTYEISSKL